MLTKITDVLTSFRDNELWIAKLTIVAICPMFELNKTFRVGDWLIAKFQTQKWRGWHKSYDIISNVRVFDYCPKQNSFNKNVTIMNIIG